MTDQSTFIAALRDANLAAPKGVINPDGTPATQRFNVYRNNVISSLIEAQEIGFPCLRKIIGPANFRILARAYVDAHPPHTALMMDYGQDMPHFVTGFAPLNDTPYVADIARLELALRRSYHATDRASIDPAVLAALSSDDLMSAQLNFVPAMQVMTSNWPIYSIWDFTMQDGEKPTGQGETCLISRVDFDPYPTLVPQGSADFIAALQSGKTIGFAYETAVNTHPQFDLSSLLSALLQGNSISHVKLKE